MKLNLDINLKSLDGKDIMEKQEDGSIKAINLANALANMLCGSTDGIEPIKAMDWALALNEKKEIDIDASDLEKLKTLITSREGLSNIIKAAYLRVFKSCVDSDNKEK